MALGWRRAISLARLGPESTATLEGPSEASSCITSLIRFSESCSIPLVSETTGTSMERCGATSRRMDLKACEGTPITTTEAVSTAFSRSCVAARDGGRSMSGRYSGF